MANALQQALQRQAMQDHLDEKIRTIKPALSHLAMHIGLIGYIMVGAKVRRRDSLQSIMAMRE